MLITCAVKKVNPEGSLSWTFVEKLRTPVLNKIQNQVIGSYMCISMILKSAQMHLKC